MITALVLSLAPLQIRVDGEGYLRLAKEGRVVFAKEAKLVAHGSHLGCDIDVDFLPAIDLPTGTTAIEIELDGSVKAVVSGSKQNVGRIVLAVFPPSAVMSDAGGYFVSSERGSLTNPGEGIAGVIRAIGSKTTTTAGPQVKVADKPKVSSKGEPNHSPVTWNGKTEIIVKPVSEVTGESFTISDIAEIHATKDLTPLLNSFVVGNTPPFGVQRGLDVNSVSLKLRAAGYPVQQWSIVVPNGAKVVRKSQAIPTIQFIDVAKKAVKDQLGLEIPLQCNSRQSDYMAPFGDVELTAESVVRSGSAINVTVAIKLDGQRLNARLITLQPDTNAACVKPNAPIKILIRVSGATMEVPGKAKAIAWLGQTVTVVTDRGTMHTGIVTGPDTVEVKL